jgi:hypothetical protein
MLPTQPLELGEAFGQTWPILWLFGTGRYLVAAGLMAAILRVSRGAGLAARKIQAYCAMPRDVRREVTTALRTAVTFSLIGLGLCVAAPNIQNTCSALRWSRCRSLRAPSSSQ